jgi:hypothetical protein
LKKRLLTALGLVVAASAGVMPAPAAHAGTNCSGGGLLCSYVDNGSNLGVLAVRNWTCTTGTTGTASTGCVSLTDTKWLYPEQHTDPKQDWDSFRVDAGYCYEVWFRVPGKNWTMTYDRSGSTTPVYVKVEDFGEAHVTDQKAGSCP